MWKNYAKNWRKNNENSEIINTIFCIIFGQFLLNFFLNFWTIFCIFFPSIFEYFFPNFYRKFLHNLMKFSWKITHFLQLFSQYLYNTLMEVLNVVQKYYETSCLHTEVVTLFNFTLDLRRSRPINYLVVCNNNQK